MNKDLLTQPFPQDVIRTRPGQRGRTLAYVDVATIIERLNAVSDFEWSFEIVKHEILEHEVVVLAKLTIDSVSKTAFGGSSITRDSSGNGVSIADDLKAASSDGLKKSASLFGIGLDLYRGAERHEELEHRRSSQPQSDARPAPPMLPQRGGAPEPIDRITSRQLAAIHAMARRRGISLPELSDLLLQRTGRTAPQHLSKKEASSVLDELSGQNGHA